MPADTLLDLAPSAAFMRAHARPVDAALFAYWFEGGPASAVEQAVAAFQNADGGFGRAIEPDFRLPDSSAMATTVGLQYLVKAGIGAGSPVVAKAIAYLVATFDPRLGGWGQVPAAVNDHPRAFWWNWEGEPEAWPGNPSAEVLAYMCMYASLVPADVLAKAEAAALAHLEAAPELEWHEVLCWIRLYEAAPEALKAKIGPRLRGFVQAVASLDSKAWAEYAPRPHLFAASPTAPFHDVVAAGIPADLDLMIAERGADGAWSPPWAWGRYEDVWPTAEAEWRGHLTAQRTKILADYGRLRA